jgi:hypothetical protein
MAINLTSFLGGLGKGYGVYDQQRRQQVALDRQQAAEDRMYESSQAAIKRQADAEARQLEQSNRAQALSIFNQIQELNRVDAEDETNTLRFIRTPGLDEAARLQEAQARRDRAKRTQNLVATLSRQPNVSGQFGDVTGVLRHSQFENPK